MHKKVFIVQSPYQLMTVLNIIYGQNADNEKNIILLAHQRLTGYQFLCDNIRRTECEFAEALCLSYKVGLRLNAYIGIVKNIIHLKKRCRAIKYFDSGVSQFYVPSDDVVCRVAYYYIKRKSPKVVLSLYDDANGTYVGSTFRKISLKGNIVYGLLLGFNYRRRIKNIYCYNPQLLLEASPSIKRIKVAFHEEVKMIMKAALNNQLDKYVGKKVVFLDQGIRDNNNLNACLKLLEKYFSKNEVLIKLHPRIESKIDYNFEMIRDEIPFEIAASSLDFTDAISITCFSGGCVMSIIMFGKSAGKSIFLQDVCSRDAKATKLMAFVRRVQKLYGNNVLLTPSTLEEFDQFLCDNRNIAGVRRLS